MTTTLPEQIPGRPRYWFAIAVAAFCALNLQTITATGQVVAEDSGPTIKLYHVVFIGLIAVVAVRRAIVRWRPEVLFYLLVTTVTSLVAYLAFYASPFAFNLLFCVYVIVVGSGLGRLLGQERVLTTLRIAAGALLVAVVIKALVYAQVFIAFFAAPLNHPVIPFFYGGGPNLEASWLALAGAFFVGTRYFFPYFATSIAISALYASRAGVVIALLVLAGEGLRRLLKLRISPTLRTSILLGAATVAVVVLLVIVSVLSNVGGIGYLAERFLNIGDEPGSLGRMVLWSGGVHAFQHHPFGVGQGNAIAAVEHEIGASLVEGNLHNLFLQHLVETGLQGLIAYLLFCALTVGRLVRSRFSNPALLYASIYLIATSIQFRGADPIFWFVYSMEMGSADAT